jgi:hypothetical protein
MPFTPQSITWPSDRALLLVHGVGDYKPGDYDRLKQALEAALGSAAWDSMAVYEMFWDPISDWFQEKLQAKDLVTRLLAQLKEFFDASHAGAWAAEGVGDVIWPVLLLDAREALRNACILQIQQIVKDGRAAGIKRPEMKLSVMCHSLGCFHTYEALSAAATDEDLQLNTSTTGIQFSSVVMVASPVQLIRAVASSLGKLVPKPGGLYCLKNPSLVAPGYTKRGGQYVPYTRRLLSLTGNLDPVGGYLWRNRLDWAYMMIPGTDRFVEEQNIVGLSSENALASLIEQALQSNERWTVQPNNPHDWVHYVEHNADRVRQWMLA